jgi:dCMP deaminase
MNWDSYFYKICEAVATKSPCLSRNIGAILVRDHSVVSTGFNGPPRGIPHCGKDRLAHDIVLQMEFTNKEIPITYPGPENCPRKYLGYPSGTHMDLCPAKHAEENAVSNAARLGVSVIGCTCYLNTVIPCSKCFGTLINAGIVEIVADDLVVYDKFTQFLIDNSSIKIRKFEL